MNDRKGVNPAGPKLVALIDGECVMCSSISQWLIARDRREAFRFASLQSPVGRKLLREGGLPEAGMDTFVLVENGRYYTKSTAALRALRALGGKWRLAFALSAVPRFLRDGVYDYVAKRRYRWFGQADSCPMPSAHTRSRFIEREEEE